MTLKKQTGKKKTNMPALSNDLVAGIILKTDPKRIVVLGDVHGDFGLLLLLLKDCAKVIDKRGNWRNGNQTCVVLVGDTIDRHRPGVPSGGEVAGEELFIHMYLNFLQRESRKHGGRVCKLLGNHEDMNMRGDLTFVSPLGKQLRQQFPIGPGTPFAKAVFSARDTYAFLQIGPYFFIHGGLGSLTRKTVPLLTIANETVKRWYRGQLHGDRDSKQVLDLVTGMLWDRDYTTSSNCNAGHLSSMFQQIQQLHGRAQPRMVVSGHSITTHNSAPDSRAFTTVVTQDGQTETLKLSPVINGTRTGMGINLSCDAQVARVDNGASRAFGHDRSRGRLPQVLEIVRNHNGRDRLRVVRHKRGLLHQTEDCLDPSIDKAAIGSILRRETSRV